MRKGVRDELEAAGIDPSREAERHLEDLAWGIRCRKTIWQMNAIISEGVKPSKKGFAASQTRKDGEAHS